MKYLGDLCAHSTCHAIGTWLVVELYVSVINDSSIFFSNLISQASEIFRVVLSHSGPGCSKLTASLIDVPLNFQTLLSRIRRQFCGKLSFFANASLIFQQKCQRIWY